MLNGKKNYFHITAFLFFLLGYYILISSSVYGITLDSGITDKITNQEEAFRGKAGYEANINIGQVVAAVIKGFLGLLGIIFVVLIVIAGNKWMNARGNEEKVEEAQDTIRRAIIGLIITVSAYAITYFVFSNLP